MPNRDDENQKEMMKEEENIIKPEIGIEIEGNSFNYKFFETLESLSKTYSQRKTAKELKVSHSVLNRRIKNAEDKLGEKLVITVGSGSELSPKGYELLDIYYKYKNRLEDRPEIIIAGGHIITGLLQAISYDLPFKTLIYSSDDESAYELAKQDLVDILALDDPLLAFENDLNFTAIAYDHLVLISPNHGKTILLPHFSDTGMFQRNTLIFNETMIKNSFILTSGMRILLSNNIMIIIIIKKALD